MNGFLNKSGIWVVLPDAMHQFISQFSSDTSFLSSTGEPVEKEQNRGRIREISISGIMIAGAPPWAEECYGVCNTDRIKSEILEAHADDEVDGILLSIDSPGGYSKGVNPLSSAVFSCAQDKPVVVYVEGQMCSGAYWAGSGATEIIVEETSELGSIGAFLTHYDYSRMLANIGITSTVVKAGEEKAVGNPTEPLSDKAKGVLQKRIDSLADLFIKAVAKNRGTKEENVRENMAEGRVFTANDAVKNGLASSVGQYSDAIAAIESRIKKEGEDMKVDELREKYPEQVAEIENAVTAQKGSQTEEVKSTALALIKAVAGEDVSVKIDALVAKGLSFEQVSAVIETMGISAKQEEKPDDSAGLKASMLHLVQAMGGQTVASSGKMEEVTGENYMESAEALAKSEDISLTEAQSKIDAQFPKARSQYLTRVNGKKVQ